MQSLLLCVAAACVACVQGQPAACLQDDAQCPSDKYCSADTHFCLDCIHCEDLNREPPRVPTSCVRSVGKCGACFKGLVDEPTGDTGAACVPAAEPPLPAYVYAIIAVTTLFVFGFVAAVIVYLLRNTDWLKVLASTRTSVETPATNGFMASAPPPPQPPPYNGYQPVRPNSPISPDVFHNEEEISRPLVKRAESTGALPVGARETASSQEARVFNNPAYVRGPHLPPSYDSVADPEPQTEHSNFEYHDEDTMESVWTPVSEPTAGDTAASISNESGVDLPSAEATTTVSEPQPGAARRACQEPGPPAKHFCVREDSNNNRERTSSERGEGSGARAIHAGVVVNVNVNQLCLPYAPAGTIL